MSLNQHKNRWQKSAPTCPWKWNFGLSRTANHSGKSRKSRSTRQTKYVQRATICLHFSRWRFSCSSRNLETSSGFASSFCSLYRQSRRRRLGPFCFCSLSYSRLACWRSSCRTTKGKRLISRSTWPSMQDLSAWRKPMQRPIQSSASASVAFQPKGTMAMTMNTTQVRRTVKISR